MRNYVLQSDECVLFKSNVTENGQDVLLVLTNLNVIFANAEEGSAQYYAIDDIKIYNGAPQLKQKMSVVEMFFTNEEREVKFKNFFDAGKFVGEARKLITGKNAFERGMEKVKKGIETVDNTLGIDTVDAVFHVADTTVDASKKEKTADKIKGYIDMAKDIVGSKKEQPALPAPTQDEKLATLQKYKKLLDDGVITQDDYDKMKGQLLT